MRVDEVGLDRQSLVVLRNGFIKPSHLQQQLSIRIVRIRIVWNQLDILFERVFGIAVGFILSIRIAENVEGGGIVRRELSRFLVMSDGLREILLAEVITTECEVCTLVVRISSHE